MSASRTSRRWQCWTPWMPQTWPIPLNRSKRSCPRTHVCWPARTPRQLMDGDQSRHTWVKQAFGLVGEVEQSYGVAS